MVQLTKTEVIQAYNDVYGISLKGVRVTFKVIDYSTNPIAPEKVAYRLFFTCPISNRKVKTTYYPLTVGFQGS
jgi:hypothetical protein